MVWDNDVRCPVCESVDRETIRAIPTHPGYTFVRCTHCGMKFYSPRLTEQYVTDNCYRGEEEALRAQHLLDAGVFIGEPECRQQQKAELRSYYRFLLALAVDDFTERNERPPTSLYEIGCSVGWFMDTAKPTIATVHGCDVNTHAVRIGRKAFGHDIDCGAFLKTDVDLSYDLIVALDYIEHTYTPVDDLRRMLEIATPGATLMIKTFLDEFDTHRLYFNPVQHVNHFTSDTLQLALSKAGWNIISFDTQRERVWAQVIALAHKPGIQNEPATQEHQ